ncbi:MAG: hypothetical protein GY738_23640, partial [Pseudoalteromonas sp.]|nr:hypothetical protein [Pseudoalteromonas sp.]
SKAFPTLLHEVDKFVYTQLRSCLNTSEKEACLNRGAMTPADIVRVGEQLHQLERETDRSFYGGKQSGGGQRNFPPRKTTDKKNEQAPSDPPIPPVFASPPPFPNANATNFRGRGGANGNGGRGRGAGGRGAGGGGRGGAVGQGAPAVESTVRCYNCGQFGHIRKNCPRPPATLPPPPPGGVRGAVADSFSASGKREPWPEFLSGLKDYCKPCHGGSENDKATTS